MTELSKKDGTIGLCCKRLNSNIIYFNRDSFIKNRSKIPHENMLTIYHELQHIIQLNYYCNPERFCLCGLFMAKDKALEKVIENYYDENYEFCADEADANYEGILALGNHINDLNEANKSKFQSLFSNS